MSRKQPSRSFSFILALCALLAASTLVACAGTEVKQAPEKPAKDPQSDAAAKPPKPSVAKMGDSHTLKGQDEGSEVKVTLMGLTDPIQPYVDPDLGEPTDTPAAGSRFFGVTVKVTNVGTATYDDAPSNGAAMVLANDTQAKEATMIDGPWNDGAASDTKLAPGSSR